MCCFKKIVTSRVGHANHNGCKQKVRLKQIEATGRGERKKTALHAVNLSTKVAQTLTHYYPVKVTTEIKQNKAQAGEAYTNYIYIAVAILRIGQGG